MKASSRKGCGRLAVLLLLSQVLLIGYAGAAQSQDQISRDEKAIIIDTISDLLTDEYIVPEMAQTLADALASRLDGGEYDNAGTPNEFADMVFRDLHTIGNDRHFYFYYSPEEAEIYNWLDSRDAADRNKAHAKLGERARLENFGFRKLERLKGNVGYLDLRFFHDPRYAGETAAASMHFLSNCDAVIIDLRATPGGHSGMVRLLSSYFLEGEVLLRTMVYKSGEERQGWTLPYVPGRQMYDKRLYILTSDATGSAAEAFSYFLKNNKRAVLVGETTRGAAHNVREVVILGKYVLNLPNKAPIDPNTGGNWEKVGVKPHIAVGKDVALDTAYQMAVEELMKESPDNFELKWVRATLNAKISPVVLDESVLRAYTGTYGNRTIFLKKGRLYYRRNEDPVYEMKALSDTLFQLLGMDDARVLFVKGDTSVEGIEVLYDDGFILRKKKTD